MSIAIVIIAYNRLDGFERLVNSLQKADYATDKVDLIISIDNSGVNTIENCARQVEWNFGEKIIRTFPERQGLKKHILSCGVFIKKYDAIVVLEDDLIVSPAFYQYAKQCVNMYSDCEDVAGISLYSHKRNVFAKYPFIPEPGIYDAYFQQMAQSWGQVWMKNQWTAFLDWYEKNKEGFELTSNLPVQLGSWGDNSWLKYHIKYCVEENKYFVYPYVSLTTCFSAAGVHSNQDDNVYQVPMYTQPKEQYELPQFGCSNAVYYDVFFEREKSIAAALGLSESDLEVDLYGNKNFEKNKKYLLSINSYDYKIIKSFAMSMRPIENNIFYGISGDTIKLYDLHEPQNNRAVDYDAEKFTYYHVISHNTKVVAKYLFGKVMQKIKRPSIKK